MSGMHSPDWHAGFDRGRRRDPYIPEGIADIELFTEGYVAGRAEYECARANIKTERNMHAGIRRMLRALRLRRR
jgi:hypothetical protein